LKLQAGDDAAKARWLDVNDSEDDFVKLYASHREMVVLALRSNPMMFGSALRTVKL
jgi:hypothetical protein